MDNDLTHQLVFQTPYPLYGLAELPPPRLHADNEGMAQPRPSISFPFYLSGTLGRRTTLVVSLCSHTISHLVTLGLL
jgi:hypothetical protein